MGLRAPVTIPVVDTDTVVGGQKVTVKKTNASLVAALEGDVATLRGAMAGMEEKLATLQDALAHSEQGKESLVAALEGNVASLRDALARSEQSKASLVAALEGDIASLRVDLESVKLDVTVKLDAVTFELASLRSALRPSPPRAITPGTLPRGRPSTPALLPATTTKAASPVSISPIRTVRTTPLLDLPTWKVVKTLERLELLGDGKLDGYMGASLCDGVSWKKDTTNRVLLSEQVRVLGLVKQWGGAEQLKKSKVVCDYFTFLGSGSLKLSCIAKCTQYVPGRGYILNEPID